jgi:glycosyltransferase involved in cell wall biosynthesis
MYRGVVAMPLTVHLVNPMWDAFGGSERRTRDLARLLARHAPEGCDVRVWSDQAVDPRIASELEIERVGPDHPRGGVLVIVGVYFPLGTWIQRARPERVIMVVNTPNPRVAQSKMLRLIGVTGSPVEIVYASHQLAGGFGWPGVVEDSPIDIDWFRPSSGRTDRPFTVGRLSRDAPSKHHPEDPALYARLLDAGVRVRVMGGRSLAGRWDPRVELVEVGTEEARAFLWTLDALVYRTAPTLFEAYGRVVVEAMACGLAVVCGRRGGYTETVRDGVDGFLFDTSEEAFEIVMRVARDEHLRTTTGRAARTRVEALRGGLGESLAAFYFRTT